MNFELQAADTALLVIDFQERLSAAMPPKVVEKHGRNLTHLLTLAARLDLPVVATEQYPQGLGPTLEHLREQMPAAPLPKTSFSVMRDADAAATVRATGRRSIVLAGMETHVCVFQTARDLVNAGWNVHVPADAVVSRTKANWRVGLSLMERAGAVITSTEAVLFDVLKVGQGEAFKEVSRLIR